MARLCTSPARVPALEMTDWRAVALDGDTLQAEKLWNSALRSAGTPLEPETSNRLSMEEVPWACAWKYPRDCAWRRTSSSAYSSRALETPRAATPPARPPAESNGCASRFNVWVANPGVVELVILFWTTVSARWYTSSACPAVARVERRVAIRRRLRFAEAHPGRKGPRRPGRDPWSAPCPGKTRRRNRPAGSAGRCRL